MPEIPEILTKAADYMAEHGYYSGYFLSSQGCVCARGAINAVVNGKPSDCGDEGGPADIATLALAKHLRLETADNFNADEILHPMNVIGWWNDVTPAQRVMAAMRGCAAELAKGATS